MRHRIKGWDLEVAHDFARAAPSLALAKRMKFATLAATYDPNAREMGVEYCRSGLRWAMCRRICLWVGECLHVVNPAAWDSNPVGATTCIHGVMDSRNQQHKEYPDIHMAPPEAITHKALT